MHSHMRILVISHCSITFSSQSGSGHSWAQQGLVENIRDKKEPHAVILMDNVEELKE